MAMKNIVEVVIAGKVYRIGGFESPEYLHQVAVYVNGKMAELAESEGYKRQNTDLRQLLLNMNLADDYFKEKARADKLSEELSGKDKELYSTRHDLIEARLENENLKAELEEMKAAAKEKEAGNAGSAGTGTRQSESRSTDNRSVRRQAARSGQGKNTGTFDGQYSLGLNEHGGQNQSK